MAINETVVQARPLGEVTGRKRKSPGADKNKEIYEGPCKTPECSNEATIGKFCDGCSARLAGFREDIENHKYRGGESIAGTKGGRAVEENAEPFPPIRRSSAPDEYMTFATGPGAVLEAEEVTDSEVDFYSQAEDRDRDDGPALFDDHDYKDPFAPREDGQDESESADTPKRRKLTKKEMEDYEQRERDRFRNDLGDPDKGIQANRRTEHRANELLEEEFGTTSPKDVMPLEFVIERVDPDSKVDEWLSPKQLLGRTLTVRPRVSRKMLLVLLSAGATVRSGTARSFHVSHTKDSKPGPNGAWEYELMINRVLDALPKVGLHTKETMAANQESIKARTAAIAKDVQEAKLQGIRAMQPVKTDFKDDHYSFAETRIGFKSSTYNSNGALLLRFGTCAEHPLMKRHEFAHQWTRKGNLAPAEVYAEQALGFIIDCRERGIEVKLEEGLEDGLANLVGEYTIARAVDGLPGRAHVVEPLPGSFEIVDGMLFTGLDGGDSRLATSREVGIGPALTALKRAKAEGRKVALDPAAADSLRMEAAKPALDGDLHGPQRVAVARARATELGIVNTSMVGTGKTPMTLIAERGRAKQLPGYRMLLVCSSALVSQWQEEEFPKFWPEVKPVLIESGDPVGQLSRLDREWGDAPGCFIATYDMVRRQTRAFQTMTYDVMVMEEGGRLGSPNTQLARAMWKLRKYAKVGQVLTATPFRKEPSELDAILAWARGDAHALKEKPLASRFGSFDQMSLRRLTEALGPAFVRVTREQMKEFMPDVEEAMHRLIDSSGPEKALKEAIEEHIASLYEDLMKKVEAASALSPDDEALKEAQRELQSRRGLVLSTISLAQQAALDPEILRNSNANAVAALEASGVLERAIRKGSTKRVIVAETVAAAEADNEQVLVFSQSVEGLKLLARELREKWNVDAPVYSGALAKAEADSLRAGFQAGEIRTLLLSPIAKEGLNLPASMVLHYDLPWVPADFEQRIGRATRTGSSHESVAILIPIMRNTIEERVCQLLVPRAAQADAVLNVAGTPVMSANGDVVDGKGSVELAVQLGGIADEFASREDASLRMKIAAQIFAERRGSNS